MSVSLTHSAPLNLVPSMHPPTSSTLFLSRTRISVIVIKASLSGSHHSSSWNITSFCIFLSSPTGSSVHFPIHQCIHLNFLEILHSAIPCFETNSVLFCEGNDPNTRRHSDISIRGPICHDSWHFFSNLLLFHIAQTFKFQKIVDFSQLNRFPL